MKPTDALTNLFSHHMWANLRLLEQCAELTDEQLSAAISGAYGSIHDTLQHITRAEQSYFSRISTGQPHRRPEGERPFTFEEMAEVLRTTGTGLIDWAPKVQADDTVKIDWDGTPRDVPKSVILTQVINHATEHRAQIMAILTQVGIEPPDLSSWSYFEELNQSL